MSTNPDQRGVSRVRRGTVRASTLSPLKGRSTHNSDDDDAKASSTTTMARLYQGIVSLQLRKFRGKAKNDHLPLHNKDNVHIQVPIRMMFSTLSIFLILPLTLFGWRQFHPTVRVDRAVGGAQNSSLALKHDRFPTWMDEINLPPLKAIESEIGESTAKNGTAILHNQDNQELDIDNESASDESKTENDSSEQARDSIMDAIETSGEDEANSHFHAAEEDEQIEEGEEDKDEEEVEENEDEGEEEDEEVEETSD